MSLIFFCRSEACADEASSGSGDSTGLYGFGMAIGVKYIAATNFDDKAKTDVRRRGSYLELSYKLSPFFISGEQNG